MDLDTIFMFSFMITFLAGPTLLIWTLIFELITRHESNFFKVFNRIAIIVYIIIAIIFFITAPMQQDQMNAEKAAKLEKIEMILKETHLSDLQSYFKNDLGVDNITYDKTNKKLIIETKIDSTVDDIVEINQKLAKNTNIKSVDFTNNDDDSEIILIINLK